MEVLKFVLVGAAAVVFSAGCNVSMRSIGSATNVAPDAAASWDESAALAPFDHSVPFAQRIALRGAMGTVDSVREPGATMTLAETNASVRIDATNTASRYWMMARIDLPDPATLRSSPLGTILDSSTNNWVDALGCAGPAPEDFTFDAPADRVRLRIDQGADADTRLVRFVANFGSQTVAGSFEITAR